MDAQHNILFSLPTVVPLVFLVVTSVYHLIIRLFTTANYAENVRSVFQLPSRFRRPAIYVKHLTSSQLMRQRNEYTRNAMQELREQMNSDTSIKNKIETTASCRAAERFASGERDISEWDWAIQHDLRRYIDSIHGFADMSKMLRFLDGNVPQLLMNNVTPSILSMAILFNIRGSMDVFFYSPAWHMVLLRLYVYLQLMMFSLKSFPHFFSLLGIFTILNSPIYILTQWKALTLDIFIVYCIVSTFCNVLDWSCFYQHSKTPPVILTFITTCMLLKGKDILLNSIQKQPLFITSPQTTASNASIIGLACFILIAHGIVFAAIPNNLSKTREFCKLTATPRNLFLSSFSSTHIPYVESTYITDMLLHIEANLYSLVNIMGDNNKHIASFLLALFGHTIYHFGIVLIVSWIFLFLLIIPVVNLLPYLASWPFALSFVAYSLPASLAVLLSLKTVRFLQHRFPSLIAAILVLFLAYFQRTHELITIVFYGLFAFIRAAVFQMVAIDIGQITLSSASNYTELKAKYLDCLTEILPKSIVWDDSSLGSKSSPLPFQTDDIPVLFILASIFFLFTLSRSVLLNNLIFLLTITVAFILEADFVKQFAASNHWQYMFFIAIFSRFIQIRFAVPLTRSLELDPTYHRKFSWFWTTYSFFVGILVVYTTLYLYPFP
eukprot:gene1664-4793_t